MAKPHFNPSTLKARFDSHRNPGKPWVIDGDHAFVDGPMHLVVVDGFRTDLTSHPRLGWFLLVTAFAYPVCPAVVLVAHLIASASLILRDPLGAQQRAAVFHDSGYALQTWPRYMVDTAYRRIMEVDGVNPVRIFLHYHGVRLFGWVAWWANSRRKK